LDRLVGGDGDRFALAQLDGLVVREAAGADLRAGEVLQDRDGTPELVRDRAHGLHHREVLVVLAVREVEAHHVDARLREALQHLTVTRGRPDGGHDLGATHAA
jgi:hypothetical protein